jgi:hypothetical protein
VWRASNDVDFRIVHHLAIDGYGDSGGELLRDFPENTKQFGHGPWIAMQLLMALGHHLFAADPIPSSAGERHNAVSRFHDAPWAQIADDRMADDAIGKWDFGERLQDFSIGTEHVDAGWESSSDLGAE